MKVIIYKNANGNVSVCYPTNEISIEDVLAKDCPKEAFIIDSSELPEKHNEFFNAWRLDNNNKVFVDIKAVKEITKERLRAERKPLLEAQDILFQRALETGADTTAIVAEKQRLRDITTLVDTANTIEELKALEAK
jgi:hypothetical protein